MSDYNSGDYNGVLTAYACISTSGTDKSIRVLV